MQYILEFMKAHLLSNVCYRQSITFTVPFCFNVFPSTFPPQTTLQLFTARKTLCKWTLAVFRKYLEATRVCESTNCDPFFWILLLRSRHSSFLFHRTNWKCNKFTKLSALQLMETNCFDLLFGDDFQKSEVKVKLQGISFLVTESTKISCIVLSYIYNKICCGSVIYLSIQLNLQTSSNYLYIFRLYMYNSGRHQERIL